MGIVRASKVEWGFCWSQSGEVQRRRFPHELGGTRIEVLLIRVIVITLHIRI